MERARQIEEDYERLCIGSHEEQYLNLPDEEEQQRCYDNYLAATSSEALRYQVERVCVCRECTRKSCSI